MSSGNTCLNCLFPSQKSALAKMYVIYSEIVFSGISMLPVIESVFILLIYGLGVFINDIQFMCGSRPTFFWRFCWRTLPFTLLVRRTVTIITHYFSLYHTTGVVRVHLRRKPERGIPATWYFPLDRQRSFVRHNPSVCSEADCVCRVQRRKNIDQTLCAGLFLLCEVHIFFLMYSRRRSRNSFVFFDSRLSFPQALKYLLILVRFSVGRGYPLYLVLRNVNEGSLIFSSSAKSLFEFLVYVPKWIFFITMPVRLSAHVW